jgi:hypothetical protein
MQKRSWFYDIDDFKLNGGELQIGNTFYCNFIRVHDVEILTKNDIEKDEKLMKYYSAGNLWVSNYTFKSLRIEISNFEKFNTIKLPPIEEMTIYFDLPSDIRKSSCDDFIDFAEKASIKKRWKISNIKLEVFWIFIPLFKEQKGVDNFFRILSLPIKNLTLQFKENKFSDMPDHYIDPLNECIIRNPHLKYFQLESYAGKLIFSNLDLKTPCEDDAERIKWAVYEALYEDRINFEHNRPWDFITITNKNIK